MTHAQSMNFRQIGSRKGAGAPFAMSKLREGIPDHVVRFDERE